ncbi:MAG: TIGR04084 family radical SAM/SPASM domain-containing protein [Archaeoglobaceae archaeon]
MLYILILTPKCNSNCRYCGGFDEALMPEKIHYEIEDLKKFLSKDPNPSIAFYGGEPLLELEEMEKIMKEIEAEHYILQTNGLLLHKLHDELLNRFSTILVSFDGRREVHEFYRGNYDVVLRNVRSLKGYSGELIARMTASQETDIYEDVMSVLSLKTFTHIHWQIDAVWSKEGVWRDFEKWVEKYNKGIRRLVKFWISEMLRGKIHGIIPFLGVSTAIFEGFSYPPCSSGFKSFAITTDGRILACPICPEFEWNYLGNIWEGIRFEPKIMEPCPSCSYFKFCGGRCLFFNRERLWGEKGFKLVCSTVKNLVDSLLSYREILEKFRDKIRYPKFLNTTEIIP